MSDRCSIGTFVFSECFQIGQVLLPTDGSLVSDEIAAPDEKDGDFGALTGRLLRPR